jgi:hypothetical protein
MCIYKHKTEGKIMANLFQVIGDFFVKVFSALFGSNLAKSLSSSLVNLAKDAVGKLAIDAVQYVQAIMPGSSSTDKQTAAVAKLKSDLTAAGKDLEQFGESVLNLLVELAVQYVKQYLPSPDAATVTDTSETAQPVATPNVSETVEQQTAAATAHVATLSPHAESDAYLKTLPPAVQEAIARQNANAQAAQVAKQIQESKLEQK